MSVRRLDKAGLRRGEPGRAEAAIEEPVAEPQSSGPLGPRFRVQQRVLVASGDFEVIDDKGTGVFHVACAHETKHAAATFRGGPARRSFTVRSPAMPGATSLAIELGPKVVARVHRSTLVPTRPTFWIECPKGRDLHVRGDVLHHEYDIVRDGCALARVSTRWFRGRDTYGVEVKAGHDALLVVTIAATLDALARMR